jgi:hypothetical protein
MVLPMTRSVLSAFPSRVFATIPVLVVGGILLGGTASAEAAGSPTWTTLTSSANPSLVGQAVTFAATVKAVGGGGTPTGAVTFKDTATVLGTGLLDAFGKATLTTSALTLGTHPIKAVYGGDDSFAGSTSDVLAQAVPSATGCSTPGFFATSGSPVTNGLPVGGDFNMDGNPDLAVVATAGAGTLPVTIWLGDGTGALVAAGSATPENYAAAAASADFNLDGKPDLAVVGTIHRTQQNYHDGYAVILLGNGSGGLVPVGSGVLVSGRPVGVDLAVADFNLDGKPDVAVVGFNASDPGGYVTILLGDGAGGLTATASQLSVGPYPSIVAADFNQDGRPDLAVSTGSSSATLTVYLGDGTGGFTTGPVTSLGSSQPHPFATGDFNLDGKPDLAWTSYSDDTVGIRLGDGSGSFGSSLPVGVPTPMGLLLGDFDLDGKPDLAVGGRGVTILRGDGTGGFVATPATADRSGTSVQVTADFNMDGRPDLAVTDSSFYVTILLNNCGAAASVTALSSSGPNPSAFGQAVTFTATVSPASGSDTPTGQVQFRDGAGNLGSPVSLTGGSATLTTSALADGVHAITAVYFGDADFAGSTSSPLAHTVLSRLTITDPTANAAAGPTTLNFIVSLSAPSSLTVTVNYATADHTAKAGIDYVATSGSLTFNPGETSKTVPVQVFQSAPGPSKDIFVTLTNPTNATLAKGAGIGTIIYSAPGSLTLYIDDPTLAEGNTGITLLGFTLSLSTASSSTVTVDYATANGTATAGTDYTATSGTVTFFPGQTTRSILVPMLGNTTVEPNKTLFVNLTNPSAGATIAKNQGTGTILNDDPATAAATTTQYRLYSPITYEHLYTTDTNEYSILPTRGWTAEGAAYTMFRDGGYYGGPTNFAVPLYRLYHPGVQQHHWTTDWYEVTVLAAGAWSYEGIPGYLIPTPVGGTIPLYRLALAQPPLHLWTTDENEKNVLSTPQRGWIYEGIIGNVIP